MFSTSRGTGARILFVFPILHAMKRYLVVAVCSGCGESTLGELVTMIIPPSVTNPSITQNNEDHYVFYDTDVLNYVEPSVFVMLPGTCGGLW